MPIIELKGKKPVIHESAFVSEMATIIGNVEIGANSSVWPGCIIRGDFAKIEIGEFSHIQDGVMIHAHMKNTPVRIGNYVIIESYCALYGCLISDLTVCGTGSIIFDGATVGETVLISPNTMITSGQVIASRVFVQGEPAATLRKLSMEEIEQNRERAERYSEVFEKLGKWLPQKKA
ncbi:MAG: gamma carbonic anhydrase family protein [Candidatus Helarchaeota archaeon]